jgi:hypothetical protein
VRGGALQVAIARTTTRCFATQAMRDPPRSVHALRERGQSVA